MGARFSNTLKKNAEFNTQKRTEKNGDKDGKTFYKLMNNAVYGKTMKNVKNSINVELVSNKKDDLKLTSNSNCVSYKLFENDLVAIRKNKVTWAFNKPAYIWICILEWSKVLSVWIPLQLH